MRPSLLSSAVALACGAVLVGCAAGTTVTGSGAPATSVVPAPATVATTTVGTTVAAPGTTAKAGAGATTPDSLPPGVSGGRLYSEPNEVIKADVGTEFAIRLPAREGASWTWDDDCINVELLDTKPDKSGGRLFRFKMVVAGACWLDFHVAEAPDPSSPADVRFTLEDSDL